jgi:hypothetical protein
MTTLRTLAYVSTPTRNPSEGDIRQIVDGAHRFNASVGVTGLLIVNDLGFLQTLEGTSPAIDDVFARIQRNPLHTDIRVFVDEPIAQRIYPDWSMFNTLDNSLDAIRVVLQYASENHLSLMTAGQIAAVKKSLERVTA